MKRNYMVLFVGAISGAIAGYLYYHYVGCQSGGCSITSDPVNSSIYGAIIGGIVFSLFKRKSKINEKLKSMIMNEDVTIIDVRTPAEYQGGHVAGSINIPMQEVSQRMSEIKSMSQPIILCCASGARSGQVASFLKKQGVDCENGGGWMEVNNLSKR